VTGPHSATVIAAGAVTAVKIAANAVDSTKIQNGSIDSTDISTGAVTSAKILDSTVTQADVNAGYRFLETSLMGSDSIISGSKTVTVTNSYVTSTCRILLTIGPTADSVPAIKVVSITTTGGSFVVGTADNANAPCNIRFWYIAIKP